MHRSLPLSLRQSLYLIAIRKQVVSDDLFLERVKLAVDHGVKQVQFADPTLPLAQRLKALLGTRVPLIIQSNVAIARAVKAQGLFFPKMDFDPKLLKDFEVEVPVRDTTDVMEAMEKGVTRVSVKVFESLHSSPGIANLSGVRGLCTMRNLWKGPMIGVGGITPQTIQSVSRVLDRGDLIACVGRLWSHPALEAPALYKNMEKA